MSDGVPAGDIRTPAGAGGSRRKETVSQPAAASRTCARLTRHLSVDAHTRRRFLDFYAWDETVQ